jgi:hypothetical protein
MDIIKKIKNAIFYFFLCVFTLLLVEVILRVVMPPLPSTSFILLSSDIYIRYTLRPNIQIELASHPLIRSKKTRIQTNGEGFRDKDHPLEKPSGIKRIIILGDSITFGSGLEYTDIYPYKLGKILKNVEVFNFGVPGYNTLQEIEILKKKGLKYSPDIVIFHGPDFSPEVPIIREFYNFWFRHINIYRFFSILKIYWLMNKKAKEDNQRICRTALSRFKDIAWLSKKYNFKILFLSNNPNNDVCSFVEEIQRMGAEVFFYSNLLPKPENSYRISWIDAHPNAEWHSIIAELLAKKLVELGWIKNEEER